MRTGREYAITEMGQFRPGMEKCDELAAGQVGYFTANIKNIERREHRRHGHRRRSTRPPRRWPGTRSRSRWSTPGCIPVNNNEFEDLREALGKLKLNDS